MDSARREIWFVWDRDGGAPRVEHQSEDAAVMEASRLAGINAGRRFYVLKAVAVAQRIEPVKVTRFGQPDDCDGIPF